MVVGCQTRTKLMETKHEAQLPAGLHILHDNGRPLQKAIKRLQHERYAAKGPPGKHYRRQCIWSIAVRSKGKIGYLATANSVHLRPARGS